MATNYIVNEGAVSTGVLNAKDTMTVTRGGTASEVTVNSGAKLTISGGGSGVNIRENGGNVILDPDAKCDFVANTFSDVTAAGGSVTVHSGTTAVSTTVGSSGELWVFSGGTASTINAAGYSIWNARVYINKGASASNVNISSSAKLYVSDGGVVSDVFLSSGTAEISGGALVNKMTVGRSATLVVAGKGSVADIVENGGNVILDPEAKVNFIANTFSDAVAAGGSITVHSGTTAVSTTVGSSGELWVFSGGTANTINATGYSIWNAYIYVNNGGSASNVNVSSSAKLYVSGGGVVRDVFVSSGSAYVSRGGKLTGKVTFGDKATVSAYDGAIVDFDISGVAAGNTALVNDLSVIKGTPTYSLTVANKQSSGTYRLADGAASFNGTITVTTAGGVEVGEVRIGQSLSVGSGRYSLAVNDNKLQVTITGDVSIKTPEVLSVAANVTTPTNRTVTVTAVFNEDSVVKQYSFNGSDWLSYTTGVAMTDNGTVYFRAGDGGSKYSAVKSYSVTNIDKIAPTKPTAYANITAETTGTVTVTANFSSDSVTKEYRIDGGAWQNYKSGVAMTDNGTVGFRGADAAGNYSEVAEYVVENIIAPGPRVIRVTADITTPTNRTVTVTATFNADSVVKQYSFNNSIWNTYTTGVAVSSNRTVYFRGGDGLGNYSEPKGYSVTNIDTVPPETPTVKASTKALTNRSVVLTATYSDDTTIRQYSLDKRNWHIYSGPVSVTENGKVYFRGIDAADNTSEVAEYEVANIDRTAPDKPVARANITAPTNQNVTVTATYSGDTSIKQYSLDNANWRVYSTGVVMQDNGKVYFRGIDVAGNISDVAVVTVGNIDRVAPDKPTVRASTTIATNQPVTVTADFTSDSAVREYSLDGTKWLTYTTGVVMKDNGKVYFRAADAAGNKSDVVTCTVKNIVDGDLLCSGKVGYGEIHLKTFKIKITQPGWYSIGNSSFGRLNGSVTISCNGKKVASGTVKNGQLTFNKNKLVLLGEANEYTVIVKNTDKGRTSGEYSFTLNPETVFDKANTDDYRQGSTQKLAKNTVINDWVGYGDSTDWWKLDAGANGGFYDFELYGIRNNVKLTVYSAQGGKVRKLKSATASLKKPRISLAELCVAPGASCYVVVEAPQAKKAKNSDYTLKMTEKATFTGLRNNDWSQAEVLTAKEEVSGVLSKAPGADLVDYYDLSKVGSLCLDMVKGKAKVSFYDAGRNKIKVATVKMANGALKQNAAALSLAAGNMTTDQITISAIDDAVRYLKIEASGKTLNSYTITKIA